MLLLWPCSAFFRLNLQTISRKLERYSCCSRRLSSNWGYFKSASQTQVLGENFFPFSGITSSLSCSGVSVCCCWLVACCFHFEASQVFCIIPCRKTLQQDQSSNDRQRPELDRHRQNKTLSCSGVGTYPLSSSSSSP